MNNPLRNLPVRYTPPPGVPGCVHETDGRLCGACWQEYLTDDEGYIEFGEHPEGRARWQKLCDEIAADVASLNARITDDGLILSEDEIPF